MESTNGIKALPAVDKFRKGLAITSQTADKPYFEDLIKFLDWAIYSEEGNDLTAWGVEGLTYEITADGNKFLPEIVSPKNKQGTIDISKEYGFNLIFDIIENEEYEDYKKPDDIVEFLDRSENAEETLKIQPQLNINASNSEIISVINEELIEYVNETRNKFITGEMDIENDWDNYIIEMDKLGYKIIENIWNDAWNN